MKGKIQSITHKEDLATVAGKDSMIEALQEMIDMIKADDSNKPKYLCTVLCVGGELHSNFRVGGKTVTVAEVLGSLEDYKLTLWKDFTNSGDHIKR